MLARRIAAAAFVAVWLAHSGAAVVAHRLDEFLQASRLSIDPDRVTIELDLTPGVSVASKVLTWLDTDGDGKISAREEARYACGVLDALTLSVDGTPTPLRLVETRFPDAIDLERGLGTIRLRAEGTTPVAARGHHRLSYQNAHHPEMSVYLVNAVVPDDPRLRIAGQHRDPAQRGLTLDYDVTVSPWSRVLWDATGLAAIGVLIAVRRPRGLSKAS
jgi:hypothetical protein